MNNKTSIKSYLITAFGIAILAAGLYIMKVISSPQGVLKALPYICVGLGCGIFGQGMGSVVSKRALKNSPDIQRQVEIDINDERNIAYYVSRKGKSL